MSAIFESPVYEHKDWRAAAAAARPTNYLRNLYHAGNAVMVTFLVMHIFTPTSMVATALAFAAFAWSCELSRRLSPAINTALMKAFKPFAHPHEHHSVNSATWIVTALLIIAALYAQPIACIGVVVVGFADPAAAIIGRRWGKTRLAGGRTLEGSLAFLAVGTVCTVALLMIYMPAVTFAGAALVGLAAAGVGALAELYSRVDDNLSIPVASSTAAWLTMAALGIDHGQGWLPSLLS